MQTTLLHSIVITLIALVALNAWMYVQQPAMIFYPLRELSETPASWGLTYEDAYFDTTDGVRLHGWYIPTPEANYTVLFFHGNAGNISHRGESVRIFQHLGFNVFIFDYRGYGLSHGRPGEAGLYQDAAAAWHYLLTQKGIDKNDIIIFGRSLGGAIATQLAAQVQPRALVLESTFASARAVARSLFPVLSRLIFMRFDFNTQKYITSVNCPLLVLHSPDDEIIPFQLGQQVYAAANQPKAFINLRGDHNSGFLISQPEYEKSLESFLSKPVF